MLKKNRTSKKKSESQFSKNQWLSGIIKTILLNMVILPSRSGLTAKALE